MGSKIKVISSLRVVQFKSNFVIPILKKVGWFLLLWNLKIRFRALIWSSVSLFTKLFMCLISFQLNIFWTKHALLQSFTIFSFNWRIGFDCFFEEQRLICITNIIKHLITYIYFLLAFVLSHLNYNKLIISRKMFMRRIFNLGVCATLALSLGTPLLFNNKYKCFW